MNSAAPHHVFALRVYYEDTDAAGIVYYANYLRFAERARTELLRAHGSDHAALMRQDGIAFAVRRCEAEYLKPARLDDSLEVHTRVTQVGGATLDADQDILRAGEVLTRLKVRLACVRADGKPARLPAGLRRSLDELPHHSDQPR
ncbi:MAG: tol-pal system-associated acyl-CoA thioesterase [Alphaproteobacteria bacterium]|nr:tol-pal system-associated acyl-CoA thioesterase [Alphaproteobacteria bacterium]